MAYDVFAGIKPPDALKALGDQFGPASSQYFYSRLYLGLYFESLGNGERSLEYMREATESTYGSNPEARDFMVWVGRVHVLQRGGGAEQGNLSEPEPSKGNLNPS